MALLPAFGVCAALGGPTSLVVVLRIGGAPLPLHTPLQATDGSRIGTQLRAQLLEPSLCFPRHDGDAGGRQVQADGVRARHVRGLVVGHAGEHQLHGVTIPFSVGALCAWTGGWAAHQAGILDRLRQGVADHRVLPLDECGQPVVAPDQVAALPFLGRLEHEAHARIVALILQNCRARGLDS